VIDIVQTINSISTNQSNSDPNVERVFFDSLTAFDKGTSIKNFEFVDEVDVAPSFAFRASVSVADLSSKILFNVSNFDAATSTFNPITTQIGDSVSSSTLTAHIQSLVAQVGSALAAASSTIVPIFTRRLRGLWAIAARPSQFLTAPVLDFSGPRQLWCSFRASRPLRLFATWQSVAQCLDAPALGCTGPRLYKSSF